jgi:polyisoprenoid-binding protein YceI
LRKPAAMTSESASRRLCLALLLAGSGLCGCAIGMGSRPQAEAPGAPYREAGNFVIAPELTRVSFEVAVVDLISVKGEFKNVAGQLVLGDEGVPRQVEITLESASAETGTDWLNDLLRGPKFFNAANHPTVMFKSSAFRQENQRLAAVDGSLTVLGVIRSATLKVAHFGCRQQAQGVQCTAQASTSIKRSEFGMTALSESVGEDVKIDISFTALQRKE